MTIACLPSSFAQYLRNKYNIVIYDASNYYCTKQGIQCIGPSDKDYYCGTRLSTIGLPIKERMNINYDNLYQPWWVTAFVINVCYILCFFCLLISCSRKEKTWSLYLSIWLGGLSMLYLMSFIPFVPAPGFRYHLFAVLTSVLSLGFFLSYETHSKHR